MAQEVDETTRKQMEGSAEEREREREAKRKKKLVESSTTQSAPLSAENIRCHREMLVLYCIRKLPTPRCTFSTTPELTTP
ncbi:hypothetical protein AMELA_G00079210 [Ameiurus melas]|uniref:Uncharacterized protein n=1 Tax=Ameiurus melas TaxID=219545 RepID=A0A7J6AZ54_AMEME|nr:hypothetical protein AMELA_G00079210 [Ameiurus melas]